MGRWFLVSLALVKSDGNIRACSVVPSSCNAVEKSATNSFLQSISWPLYSHAKKELATTILHRLSKLQAFMPVGCRRIVMELALPVSKILYTLTHGKSC